MAATEAEMTIEAGEVTPTVEAFRRFTWPELNTLFHAQVAMWEQTRGWCESMLAAGTCGWRWSLERRRDRLVALAKLTGTSDEELAPVLALVDAALALPDAVAS